MNKNKLPKKEINPLEGCPIPAGSIESAKSVNDALKLLDKPTAFIERLKDNPWLIATNPIFQVAVRMLQTKCLLGTQDQVRSAKSLLQKAGIPVFIPKEIPKRITDNATLRWWQNDPNFFISQVNLFTHLIESCIPKSPKGKHNIEKSYIAEAFQFSFKKPMPKGLIFGERDKDITSIALAFISHRWGVSFEALRSYYYDLPEQVRNSRQYKSDLPIPFNFPKD